ELLEKTPGVMRDDRGRIRTVGGAAIPEGRFMEITRLNKQTQEYNKTLDEQRQTLDRVTARTKQSLLGEIALVEHRIKAIQDTVELTASEQKQLEALVRLQRELRDQ